MKITLYLFVALLTVVLSCTSLGTIETSGNELDQTALVYNLTRDAFDRIFLLYPQCNSDILEIAYDIYDNIDIDKSGSYVSACFSELNDYLKLILSEKEFLKVQAYAAILSMLIEIPDSNVISDNDKNDLTSMCVAIQESVKHIRMFRDFNGDIPKGLEI